jgi:uncharacterized protein
LVEGIFFAKLVATFNGKSAEIDARTSDAVAIAVRFNCPIYCYEFILDAAGVSSEDTGAEMELEDADLDLEELTTSTDASSLSLDELQKQLENALNHEDYEKASRLRDEINKRSAQ